MLLLTILKVIGLVLLAVLLLLLFLLLVVLLVPIRYRAAGRRTEDGDYAISGEISWLLRLVRFRAAFDPGGLQYSLRVLWLRLLEHPKKRGRKAAEDEAAGREKPAEEPEVSSAGDGDGTGTMQDTVKPEEEEPQKKETAEVVMQTDADPVLPSDASEEKPVTPEAASPAHPKAAGTREVQEPPKMESEAPKDIPKARKRATLTEKLRRRITSASDRIRHLCRKLSAWRSIAEDEENQKAAALLMSRIRYLLHHMRLRSLQGELTIGSEDPELMGRVLGLLSLFYPLYEERFTIRPEFDHAAFYGEFETRGHLRLLHPVVVVIQILLNKKLRHLIFEHL